MVVGEMYSQISISIMRFQGLLHVSMQKSSLLNGNCQDTASPLQFQRAASAPHVPDAPPPPACDSMKSDTFHMSPALLPSLWNLVRIWVVINNTLICN